MQKAWKDKIFNWWFSGKYWYCNLKASNKYLSGAGVTKNDAYADFYKSFSSK